MIAVIAASGHDFAVIATEHVAINDETLAHLIRAAEAAHIIPIVRVTAALDTAIIKMLDMGARGLIVPHVKDRAT
ncbi:siderophore biosynthesis protein SbnG, partial [Staphylococcus aureus]